MKKADKLTNKIKIKLIIEKLELNYQEYLYLFGARLYVLIYLPKPYDTFINGWKFDNNL